jgi:hypothetical protein
MLIKALDGPQRKVKKLAQVFEMVGDVGIEPTTR